MIPKKEIINVPITCLPFDEQMMLIWRWAKMRSSKAVCLANVHMVMEANQNSSFKKVLHQADLVTPDGKPLVLMLRRLGILHQNQVPGMEVFLHLCDLAEKTGIPIYFLGSTEDILTQMEQKLNEEYPILKVAGMKSIPFMSIEQIRQTKDKKLIEEVNNSGAGIVFVCLGCPKQEVWMSQYQGHIKGVMIGVGAVFSMYAGLTPRAPYLVQQAGFEWLYRLSQEPRRLWYRYGSTIPPFMYFAAKQLFSKKKSSKAKNLPSETSWGMNVETLDFSPEKLGAILIRQNILTVEELEQALLQQKLHPDLKLGEILVRNNLISLSQLKFYLKNQNIKFGQLLVERKFIKQHILNEVLYLQSQVHKKLGEILIKYKNIPEDRINAILYEQYARRKGLFLSDNSSNKQQPLSSEKLAKVN